MIEDWLGSTPRRGFGWAHPSPVEPRPVVDDDMPVVVVSGLWASAIRQVRLELVEAWRELGRPIIVAVSVWDARSAVGREARGFAAVHAVCGIRWQPCVTRPERVDRVLEFEGARKPASGWAA